MKHKCITLPSGRSVRKFIPYPGAVLDGTVRCFFCGQIDEPDYHEPEYCSALGDAQTLKDNGHG